VGAAHDLDVYEELRRNAVGEADNCSLNGRQLGSWIAVFSISGFARQRGEARPIKSLSHNSGLWGLDSSRHARESHVR